MRNLLSHDAINAPLLLRAKAHIQQHPNSIYMSFWGNGPITYDKTSETRFSKDARACIGTWAVALHEGHVDPNALNIGAKAREVLWLDEEQGANLFFENCWPPEFSRRLWQAYGNRNEYARVVCDRIESFIAANGRDGTYAKRRGVLEIQCFGSHGVVPLSFDGLIQRLGAAFERVSADFQPAVYPLPDGLISQIRQAHRFHSGPEHSFCVFGTEPSNGVETSTSHPWQIMDENFSGGLTPVAPSRGFSISGPSPLARPSAAQMSMILDDVVVGSLMSHAVSEQRYQMPDFLRAEPDSAIPSFLREPPPTVPVVRPVSSVSTFLNPNVLSPGAELLVEYASGRRSEVLRPNGGVGLTLPDGASAHTEPPLGSNSRFWRDAYLRLPETATDRSYPPLQFHPVREHAPSRPEAFERLYQGSWDTASTEELD